MYKVLAARDPEIDSTPLICSILYTIGHLWGAWMGSH